MRPRPLSRREALLGAAMCAALALAWRETYEGPLMRPGPGRSGLGADYLDAPLKGGHGEAGRGAALGAGGPEDAALAAEAADASTLRDAPAEAPAFTPLLTLPPLGEAAATPGRAPAAAAAGAARRRAASEEKARLAAGREKARAEALRRAAAQGGHDSSPGGASSPDGARLLPSRAARALAAPALSAAALAKAAAEGARAAARAKEQAAAPAARGPARAAKKAGFDLFKPGRAAVERSRRERAANPPRLRPPLFDRALGPHALRPPSEDVGRPTLAELGARQPLSRHDGKPARWADAPLRFLESVDPEEAELSCRRRDGHWHAEPEQERVFHAGPGRGLAAGDAFLWLSRLERRWWALPEASSAPWLRHRGRWWTRGEDVWFVLHEGERWAWRHFSRWEADGLIHPASGTVMVYSADYARAAVITPGEGAVLFDAVTGEELARWSEAELPPRWRPAPETLALPRGV